LSLDQVVYVYGGGIPLTRHLLADGHEVVSLASPVRNPLPIWSPLECNVVARSATPKLLDQGVVSVADGCLTAFPGGWFAV